MSPVHEERYHPAGVLSSGCVKRNLSLLEKTSDRVTAQSTVPKILPDFGGFKKSMSVISIPTQQMTTQLKSVQKRPTVGPGPITSKVRINGTLTNTCFALCQKQLSGENL